MRIVPFLVVAAVVLAGCAQETPEEAFARKGGVRVVADIDTSDVGADPVDAVVSRVIEIVRGRIDGAAISNPLIETEGKTRIVVSLPGFRDTERAAALVGSPGRLEFFLVQDSGECEKTLRKLDYALRSTDPKTRSASGEKPFTSYLVWDDCNSLAVEERNKEAVAHLLSTPRAQSVMPGESAFLWDDKTRPIPGSEEGRMLYLVRMPAVLDGTHIVDAAVRPDEYNLDFADVAFRLDPSGRDILSQVTGNNIGRRVAIALDGSVLSAPVIQAKIPGGEGRITGLHRETEAKDLAAILKSGSFPVPVTIVESHVQAPRG